MIKLFISHRDSAKALAHELAKQLTRLGVTSFVAHDTIEPDEDWQHEIETALHTMDVMLALLTDGFFESAWTNQEIGFALAKGVPMISLKIDSVDPAGFTRNRQAIKGRRGKHSVCSESVFDTILKRLDGKPVLRRALITRFTGAWNFDAAGKCFAGVEALENLSDAEVDELVRVFNENDQLRGCWALTMDNRFLRFVNACSAGTFEMSGRVIVEEGTEET